LDVYYGLKAGHLGINANHPFGVSAGFVVLTGSDICVALKFV